MIDAQQMTFFVSGRDAAALRVACAAANQPLSEFLRSRLGCQDVRLCGNRGPKSTVLEVKERLTLQTRLTDPMLLAVCSQATLYRAASGGRIQVATAARLREALLTPRGEA